MDIERKYPDYIMKNVRQHLGLESDDTSKDDFIMKQTEEEIIETYFAQKGILGYGVEIINVVSDVYRT